MKNSADFIRQCCHFSLLGGLLIASSGSAFSPAPWGFYAHQRINRLAVFCLPSELLPFYKKHLPYLMDFSTAPDERRYAVKEEAPRHYIDLDLYGDSAAYRLPHRWSEAVERFSEDSLLARGIVPWHILRMKNQLTEAFKNQEVQRVLRLSAELGHYVADAHVPLHTTQNYNGQLTGQEGIHAFWESRLPELFAEQYDFFVGKATYLPYPPKPVWQAIAQAHAGVDSVFFWEKELTQRLGVTSKYAIDERNGQAIKTYARAFASQYHAALRGQVQRQMRASIKLIADLWYTSWVDAGQPDVRPWLSPNFVAPDPATERATWQKPQFPARKENEN